MSFNSVYTQIWRVLLHLAADPYPDVSDLAMKVLNGIAYKVRGRRASLGVRAPRTTAAWPPLGPPRARPGARRWWGEDPLGVWATCGDVLSPFLGPGPGGVSPATSWCCSRFRCFSAPVPATAPVSLAPCLLAPGSVCRSGSSVEVEAGVTEAPSAAGHREQRRVTRVRARVCACVCMCVCTRVYTLFLCALG